MPKTAWTEGPEIENPVEGVYVLGGYLISACIVVEAEEGLVVFDTGDTDKVILFDFQGNHRTVGLHIRRAVAEYLDGPDEHCKPGDVIMSLLGEAWAKLYLSQATVLELVKSKEIEMRRGTAEEAERLIDLFDKYRPQKAVLVAPHLHD